jgi:Protein of unknown function DUF262
VWYGRHMSRGLEALERLPEARTETVSDLVLYAQQGRIRTPDFQRGLKWLVRDVLDFLDSIYRGLPVGSLLLWKRKAVAGKVSLGPLEITAPEFAEGWWVVDGQQRVTSLAASLLRPLPLPSHPNKNDPFIVYFDSSKAQFEGPKKDGEVPVEWVPLPVLLDATRLSEWVHEWALGNDRERRLRIFEAGKRIREYKLPLYLVEASNPEVLKEIFYRVNKSGKPLSWEDVYDALYGNASGPPSTIVELSEELLTLGMGTLDGRTITTCLLALRGLDVTRSLGEHRRKDPDKLHNAVADALPVLRQVLTFLKMRAAVPHVRLLPRAVVLEVLTRFFAVHPEAGARTLELLVRWIWRMLLGDLRIDERTLERRAVAAVSDDEEASVQQLLYLVPRTASRFTLPERFDARKAGSRLALLALVSLQPRNLRDEHPIDVGALVDSRGADAFGSIIRGSHGGAAHGPENRILHPGPGTFRQLINERISRCGIDDPVLRSHAIGPESADALRNGKIEQFLTRRRMDIGSTLNLLGTRLASWDRDQDRPSIQYILNHAGEEEE